MVGDHAIAGFRYVQGSFNILTALLFFYQGGLGFKIRKARKSGVSISVKTVKRHRTLGPILVFMGISGFIAGLLPVYIDHGDIFKFPLHLFTGLTIAFAAASTFVVSKKIKGPDSTWRTPHVILGILILCLYIVQVFLGLGILL